MSNTTESDSTNVTHEEDMTFIRTDADRAHEEVILAARAVFAEVSSAAEADMGQKLAEAANLYNETFSKIISGYEAIIAGAPSVNDPDGIAKSVMAEAINATLEVYINTNLSGIVDMTALIAKALIDFNEAYVQSLVAKNVANEIAQAAESNAV